MKDKNTIPNIRVISDGMQGKNYGFNDCAAYVMEALSEPEYDYWFFAGLTGDNFAQIFTYDRVRGAGVTDYLQGDGDHSFAVRIFNACGYDADFIPETVLRADPEPHLQRLMAYIDKGVPVIRSWCGWHVCVGYEDGGKTLLCMTDNNKEPYRVTAEELFAGGQEHRDGFDWFGWVFVGEKKEQKDLRQLYRDVIANLPKLLTTKTDGYCFGAGAFRAWADEIESGKYDGMKPEDFDAWAMHTNYVCCMATNSGGSQEFMRRAMKLNPDLAFLKDVCRQYRSTGFLWYIRDSGWYLYECPKGHGQPCRKEQGCQNCKQLTPEQAQDKKRYGKVKDLEKLGGGFNIQLKTLQKPGRKRAKIAAVIRQCADCMDEAVRILETEAQGASQAVSSFGGSGILPGIRGILDGMKGHNYALPDCLMFIWECLNENPEMDFWRFAAVTGDTVAQVYNNNPTTRCDYCVSSYLAGPKYISAVFDAIGYGHSYATAKQINADKKAYLQKVMTHIDKGLPVLVKTNIADVAGWISDIGTYCLIVGYAEYGKTLLVLTADDKPISYDASGEIKMDWIFVGEKQREVSLEELYLYAIRNMAHWLTLPERDGMFFGAAAFRAWADDIENGRYEDEAVGLWDDYGVYVCNLATSGGEPTYLFHHLAEINPQYADYADLGKKLQRLIPSETPTGGKTLDWIRLEKLKGGLHAKRKALCKKRRRSKIAAVLRERADHLDEVVRILNENLE